MAKAAAKLSARQAAEQIGTDAKTLRRFLRENDSYTNVGSGGRYSFTQREVTSMAKAFASWNVDRPKKTAPASEKTAKTPASKSKTESAADKKKRAEARVDKLEKSLKDRGVHISQHQESA